MELPALRTRVPQREWGKRLEIQKVVSFARGFETGMRVVSAVPRCLSSNLDARSTQSYRLAFGHTEFTLSQVFQPGINESSKSVPMLSIHPAQPCLWRQQFTGQTKALIYQILVKRRECHCKSDLVPVISCPSMNLATRWNYNSIQLNPIIHHDHGPSSQQGAPLPITQLVFQMRRPSQSTIRNKQFRLSILCRAKYAASPQTSL